MMLRLGLPALGSKLRLPTTPAAGGAGGSKNPNSFKPVKRRNPKGKPTQPDPNFDMILRVRKAVDYTDVADVPKPGPPKCPRVEPATHSCPAPRLLGREPPWRPSIPSTRRTRKRASALFDWMYVENPPRDVPFFSRTESRASAHSCAFSLATRRSQRRSDFFPEFLIRILSRRRRSGTPTRSSGTKSARSTGERSTKIDARGGLPRLPTPPLRSSAARRRRTNSSPSERRKALRPRRTTSPCAASRARWIRHPRPIRWRPRRRALATRPGTSRISPRLTISLPQALFFFLRDVHAKADLTRFARPRRHRRDPTKQVGAKRWIDQVRRDTHDQSSVIMCSHHVRVELTLKHSFAGHRAGLLRRRLRHRPDQSVVRQQDRNEQTGLRQVLHSAVGGPRPRVRRRV